MAGGTSEYRRKESKGMDLRFNQSGKGVWFRLWLQQVLMNSAKVGSGWYRWNQDEKARRTNRKGHARDVMLARKARGKAPMAMISAGISWRYYSVARNL